MINIKDIIIFPQGVPSTLLHTFKTFSLHCQVNFNILLLILRKVLTVTMMMMMIITRMAPTLLGPTSRHILLLNAPVLGLEELLARVYQTPHRSIA